MTTKIEKAREALDESMSVLASATMSLSHISDVLLDSHDVDDSGRIVVSRENINTVTWLASHVSDLVQGHIKIWDGLDDLIREKTDEPA